MSPDVAASVKARLLNGARARGEEFERTLTRFGDERFLFRLGQSEARDRCILKGAGLLTVWLDEPYRATRDVDLLASGPQDDETIRRLIEIICAVQCPEDGLRFDLSGLTVEPIRAEEEYSGKRARFIAWLGAARITIQVDFGFGDIVVGGPGEIDYPTMLPGLPVSRLKAYPRAASVAEKFEAMVKLGTRNSRMKDFHDIWALSTEFDFDGMELRDAADACFERRRTPWTDETPDVLTTAFYHDSLLQKQWAGYLRSGSVRVAPPARFELIGERIIQFLSLVRERIIARTRFDARWLAGGPWEVLQ